MMILQQAIADAKRAQMQTGVSDLAAALALAVAGPESGWDQSAPGDYMLNGRIVRKGTPGAIPTSFGYTQLHTSIGGDGGGLGNGHSPNELLDGVANFRIAMVEIQRRLNEGLEPWDALEPWSTRAQAMGGLAESQAALGADIPREMSAGVDGAAIGVLVLLGIAAVVLLS